jgi:hypothetical protein
MLSRKINGRRAGAPTPAIQNDVVDPDLERGIDVLLDLLRGELEPDRNSPRRLANLLSEIAKSRDVVPLGKAGGRNRGLPFGESTNLGDPPLDLGPGQMPPGAGLRSLAALEMESLRELHLFHAEPEAR